ncbi:MAG: hypothetical protein PHS81_00865 [Candidatus Nanoarchaeia archaeon]|nr:hypothetical protein [Candidatus Nanoarchaeia archaeon]
MKDKIIALMGKLGPIVPTDISKALGVDSYVASAVLSELVGSGIVFFSRKKMSTSPLYYLKGQEDLMRKRLVSILSIPEINILDFFSKNKLIKRDNLEPQQRYMVDELRDFISPMILKINGEDAFFYKHFSVSESEVIEKFRAWSQKMPDESGKSKIAEAQPHKEKLKEALKESRSEKRDDAKRVDSASEKFFEKNDLEILELNVVKKSKEFDFTAKQGSGVGQTFFVKYLKKASINESDISRAFASAQSKKMPCIILVSGKLSKKAAELVNGLGYLINLIKI